jgi:hypothetical protein
MPTKLVFHKYILLNAILFSKKPPFTLETTPRFTLQLTNYYYNINMDLLLNKEFETSLSM